MRVAALFATVVAALFGTAPGGTAGAAEVEAVIRGVAHDKGTVKVALYATAESFRKEDKALSVQAQPARAGEMTFAFAGLNPDRYAIVAYHDENGNGEMDRFLGMIPTEGYGLSNNPEVSGPPQFDPSAFGVAGAPPTRTVIDLRY